MRLLYALALMSLSSAAVYAQPDEYRTPVMSPIAPGTTPVCEEPPSEAEILRAFSSTSPARSLNRESIEIVSERLVDKIDPPRFFPLVGRAQLHHCHWKCSVFFTESIDIELPFSVTLTQRRVEVIYIDKDHFHLCVGESE